MDKTDCLNPLRTCTHGVMRQSTYTNNNINLLHRSTPLVLFLMRLTMMSGGPQSLQLGLQISILNRCGPYTLKKYGHSSLNIFNLSFQLQRSEKWDE